MPAEIPLFSQSERLPLTINVRSVFFRKTGKATPRGKPEGMLWRTLLSPTVAHFAYHAAAIDILFRKNKHRCQERRFVINRPA
jgi:hypothetical protein